MVKDRWLPSGYLLPKEVRLLECLYSGDDWQIYAGQNSEKILIASARIAKIWQEKHLLEKDSMFDLEFAGTKFSGLICAERFILAPLGEDVYPGNMRDAMHFATALNVARGICPDASFHDAIFVEEHLALLPLWTETDSVPDDIVLGNWLSGGVLISTNNIERLHEITKYWLSFNDLNEIVERAGLGKQRLMLKKATKKDKNAEFSLPGQPVLEQFFNEHIIDIVRNKMRYKAMGIDFPSPIILEGPPGCGKTFSVEKLVEFLGWTVFYLNASNIGSPYIHETSVKIMQLFEKAKTKAPAIIVIDEMEAFLSGRGNDQRHHVEEMSEFLKLIPEAAKNQILIIGMTNMIENIDPAILRRGRFDHIVKVTQPKQKEILDLLKNLLANIQITDDLPLEQIAKRLEGRPISDIAFLVREASRLAVRNRTDTIDQECLLTAFKSLNSQISTNPLIIPNTSLAKQAKPQTKCKKIQFDKANDSLNIIDEDTEDDA